MSSKAERIRELIGQWNETLPEALRVPPSDVSAVAEAGRVDIGLSAQGFAWQAALAYLTKQASMGVAVDAVLRNPADVLRPPATDAGPSPAASGAAQLPDEGLHRLRSRVEELEGGVREAEPDPASQSVPKPVVADSATAGPLTTRRFAAIGDMRERLVAEGNPNIGKLSVAYQRALAQSAATTADEIRNDPRLPATVKELANDLAAALAAVPAPRRVEPGGPPVPATATTNFSAPSIASSPPASARADSLPTAPSSPSPLSTLPSGQDMSSLRFATYQGTVAPGEIAQVETIRTPDGSAILSWPRGAGTFIDRVVRGDQYAPYSPDSAVLVAVTDAATAEDDAPFQHAVRHYQVWRHTGPTLRDAALQQPVLVATGVVIATPRGIEIGVDSGSVVTGTWEVESGTQTVGVYRVPIEHASVAGVGSPGFRIHSHLPLRGGFTDSEVEPGRNYVYQVVAEAEVGGETHTSAPVFQEITVTERHEPVRDLSFTLRESAPSAWFDLTWTDPPGGRVVIYRTTTMPTAGYDQQTIAFSALSAAGLNPEDRLSHPVDREEGRAAMHSVPWPREWSKAFFTPVVEMGDSVYLGNTVTGIRVPSPDRIKIIERVQQKLLTFDFPDGANEVRVFVGPRDVPADAVTTGAPVVTISRTEYEQLGSVQLGRHHLPQVCTVHLVAYSSHGSETVRSAPTSKDYTPVMIIDYRVSYGIGITAAARRPKITLQCERNLQLSPGIGFVLGFHPDRLPLTVSDSAAHIALVRDVEESSTAAQRVLVPTLSVTGHAEPGWKADPAAWSSVVTRGGGYVRLFVDDPRYQPHVALLDPPLGSLRVGGILKR